jgi:ABC-2 type transport system ATP-binding protein
LLTIVNSTRWGGDPGTFPTLVVENLEKRFRDLVAVRDLNLQVGPGEIYGLLGPNGAGKSTTMSCITGILTPTNGSVEIGGHPAQSMEAKEMLGFVPDELRLPDTLTGGEYLRFVSRVYAKGSPERANSLAQIMGIVDALPRLIREYSHGMHKKLQIAAALVHQPALLILDEPFRGLDPEALMIVREVLASRRRAGLSTLLATHELAAAATMCDRIGIIAAGELKVEGEPAQLRELFKGKSFDEIYLEVSGLLARREDVREMLATLEDADGAEKVRDVR